MGLFIMRLFVAAAIFFGLIGAVLYWQMLDGATPEDADYQFPISQMRALIDASNAPLPQAVNVEIISFDEAPLVAAHAGFNFQPFALANSSYQVKGAAGDIVIDAAVDDAIFAEWKVGKDAKFHAEAYSRMIDAMSAADAVLVTHEHYDHVIGVARHPDPAAMTTKLLLRSEHIDVLAGFSEDGVLAPAYAALQPADLDAPRLIAPGVVSAPAPGHSPGALIFLVRTESGQEYLIIGDIVWAMKNVEKAWGRPRVLQWLFFKGGEDRAQVQRQVRALHDLSKREPSLILLPAHDHAYLKNLLARGELGDQFE